MKLCFIGIAGLHVSRWIKYFVDKGHDVSLITACGAAELPIKGVRYVTFGSHPFRLYKIIRNLILFKKLKEIVNELKPDVIHVHQLVDLAYLIPFLKFHPYILSAWGSDVLIRPYISRIHSYMASIAIKKADLLHCDGFKTSQAVEKLGASSEKIVRINYGIDTDNFNPESRSMEFRKKIGIEQSPIIISTRGLSPIYDIATLIHAIPKVISEVQDATFIIGSSGPMKEELEELAKNLNVSDNTIFTGRISDDDFPYYVASSDIYISTSLSDGGLASSTGEAMACGLPVIVTEDPDNRDWIKDGVNGFVVPVKTPSVLADRIIELVKNENMRTEFGKLNRRIIIEKNSYNTEMRKIEAIYEKIIKNAF